MNGLRADGGQRITGRIGRIDRYRAVRRGARQYLQSRPIGPRGVVVGHVRERGIVECRVVVVGLVIGTLRVAHVVIENIIGKHVFTADLGYFRIQILFLVAQLLAEGRRVDKADGAVRVDRRRASEIPAEKVARYRLGVAGVVVAHEVLVVFIRRPAEIGTVTVPLAVIVVVPLLESRVRLV